MSSLSLRALPRELEKALLHEAKKEGKTKSEIVIEALESRLHLDSRLKKGRKLRQFFGKMSLEEFEAFKLATEDFSKIESDLWS